MLLPLHKTYFPVIEVNCLTYSNYHSAGLGLDRFIAQCYNLDKDFEILESPNDTHYKCTVVAKLEDYEKTYTEKALKAGWCTIYGLHNVLTKMAVDGFITEGTYLIYMGW